jgi:hypothetical protein
MSLDHCPICGSSRAPFGEHRCSSRLLTRTDRADHRASLGRRGDTYRTPYNTRLGDGFQRLRGHDEPEPR